MQPRKSTPPPIFYGYEPTPLQLHCNIFSCITRAGILVVVAIGVALGVFIGGTLLTVVAFCMKR